MNTIYLVRLSERGTSAQKLWALVLLLAIKDGAVKVWYDPAQGESRLGYEIGGVKYEMVPPPEAIEYRLLQTMGDLLHPRSNWGFIGGLFGGAVNRPIPLEGTFIAKVKEHELIVSASLSPERSRVVLRFSSEPLAAPAAWSALESAIKKVT